MDVMIDPGHSAVDPGTRRYGVEFEGASEQAINWSIAAIMRPLVGRATQAMFGIPLSCELTRKPLQVVSLGQRARKANRAKTDLFLSVHCNADFKNDGYENLKETDDDYPWESEPQSHGIETFHYPGSALGRKAAHCIHQSLIEATGGRDRGVKETKFSVLRKTKMPAVLVEVGFLSNPIERGMLVTYAYQRVIAEGLVHGICNAVIVIGKRPRIITPRRRP